MKTGAFFMQDMMFFWLGWNGSTLNDQNVLLIQVDHFLQKSAYLFVLIAIANQ